MTKQINKFLKYVRTMSKNQKQRMWTAIFLVIAPLLAFWLMQLALGCGFWMYGPGIVLGNYAVLGFAYFLLCGITKRIPLSAIIIQVIAVGWGIMNGFMIQFRGNPILPWDFTALNTALAVAESYKFIPNIWMIVAVVLLVLICVAEVCLCGRGPVVLGKQKIKFTAIVCFVGILCLIGTMSPKFLEKCGIQADVWNQAKSCKQTGAAASFAMNLKFLNVDVPNGYSKERAETLLSEAAQKQKNESTIQNTFVQPNIIAIMNESWADFEDYGYLNLSESVTDYIKSLDNTIYGHAYTSVFGAGTSASEFEFLTGHSMNYLPSGSIPYQQYVVTPKDSLASLLKEQGYQCLAMHPGERTSWQRNQAYPLLGFDQFTCMDDMHVSLSDEHGYIGDDSSFNEIIYEYEHRDQEKPFFMFNVTIQNHGSYNDEDYPAEVHVLDAEGEFPQAEQYLTLVNKTDEDFKILVDYFKQCETPTIILMFGDHQPSVETGFLEMAYGVLFTEMNMDQYMGKFKVPFVIWANYDLPDEEIDITSLNFLKQYLLDYAGVPKSDYDYYLDSLRSIMPAMTFVGYYDTEGTAYSHLQRTEFDSLIEDYGVVQYNMIFD